jgi:hypothetical protein
MILLIAGSWARSLKSPSERDIFLLKELCKDFDPAATWTPVEEYCREFENQGVAAEIAELLKSSRWQTIMQGVVEENVQAVFLTHVYL